MKKAMKKVTTLVWTIMVLGITGITASAGNWEKDADGYWYDNGGGTFPVNTWQWIDGNNDGTAECYYFDAAGYMLSNTNTPDGYAVNESGAWMVNGVIRTQDMQTQTGNSLTGTVAISGYNADGINNVAIDLIHSTRTDANVKYGPEKAYIGGSAISVFYESNIFNVMWALRSGHERAFEQNPSNMDNYYILSVTCNKRTDMVNFLTASDENKSPEELIKLLKSKGYDAAGNDISCHVTFENYQVQFYWNGNVQLGLRIK